MKETKNYKKAVVIFLCAIFLGYVTAFRMEFPYTALCVLNDGTLIIFFMMMIAAAAGKQKIKICSITAGLGFSIGSSWIRNLGLFFQLGEQPTDYISYAVTDTIVTLLVFFFIGNILYQCWKRKTGCWILTILLIFYWAYILSQYAWNRQELPAVIINIGILGVLVLITIARSISVKKPSVQMKRITETIKVKE